MIPNFLVIAACSLIPFLIAFIWYSPSLFGGDNWNKIADIPADKAAVAVKPLKLVLSILLNFLLAFGVFAMTSHDFAMLGLVGGDPELLKTGTGAAFLAEYGGKFLTPTHGLVHGLVSTIAFALPVVGYATIFERKSAKYFWVNMGFWYISISIMAIILAMYGSMPI
jgi:hypothetical protein